MLLKYFFNERKKFVSEAKNPKELLALAAYAHDRVNPYLFIYAFSVALIHRPDTKSIKIPNQIQTFPDKYFDSQVFSKAREELEVVPQGLRVNFKSHSAVFYFINCKLVIFRILLKFHAITQPLIWTKNTE